VGNAQQPIRVLIADDHTLFREGLRMLIESDAALCVVGEARDGREAAELTSKLKPNVVLLDLCMPRCPGMEALGLIQSLSLPVRTLILATVVEKFQYLEALRRGAFGILLKESTTQLLHKSIYTVMAGEYWVGRQSVSDLVGELMRQPKKGSGHTPKTNWKLTLREKEIVGEIASGKTNKEIAQKLDLSEQTVKHHLTNIFDKLGVFNRLELALFYMHHATVDDADPGAVEQGGGTI
jgi:two-component system, NarL family, nitrate/nitrite response regulator NarL